jgi:hypothetical protein
MPACAGMTRFSAFLAEKHNAMPIDPQKLAALFLLGVVLFNYPVLSLFNKAASAFGIPIVYLYIFLAWAGLIALVAWTVERRR